MSDKLPAVTGPQLIKALSRRGCARNRALKRGTLASILRTAGISREELGRLL